MEIGVCFGNYDFAVRMSVLIQPHIKNDGSYVGTSKELFYSGLAYSGLVRETGIHRYQSKAVKCLKKLKHLCRTRGRNVHHKCLLMEAEVASARYGMASKLMEMYDRAIAAAIQAGYIQDAALGSELAGTSMLALRQENHAYQYLSQSRHLWREYGAHAKVKDLLVLHGRKLEISGVVTSDTIPNPVFSSGDFSEPPKALDLDLLSGTAAKTDFQSKSSGSRESVKEKTDEVSILSDPSDSAAPRKSWTETVRWSRQ
jgi:hypothetical protein